LQNATPERVKVFPKLSAVVRQDAKVLLGHDVNFETLFCNKSDSAEDIEFYRRRRRYYARYHYGFTDMVYATVRLFEKHPKRIPQYSQVVVDEFQDFNALEVRLIDLLASKSPVLLAGDDDQALYENLKRASTSHIRQRHRDADSGYESFTLPYCSRCTRVIVDATNDVISNATKRGCLCGRIDKPFLYFDDPERDQASNDNPQLVYGPRHESQIPWFIAEQIKYIAREIRDPFTVLLISPIPKKLKRIVTALRKKGFQNVHYVQRQETRPPTLLDGLNLLLEDLASNLGWRVAAEALLPNDEFRSVLSETADTDSARLLRDIIAPESKRKVRALLKSLRAVRNDEAPRDENRIPDLLKQLGVDPLRMATESLRDRVKSSAKSFLEYGIRHISIEATTVPGSKGLEADYVFIMHLDDRYFMRHADKPRVSDGDICGFVVALTRARRKVFLISSVTKEKPTFVKWIKSERIHSI